MFAGNHQPKYNNDESSPLCHRYFDFQLCPSQDITDECFAANRLMRAGCTNKNDRNCYRAWKTVAEYESGSWIVTQNNYKGALVTGPQTTTYKMRFQVCRRCCARPGWAKYRNRLQSLDRLWWPDFVAFLQFENTILLGWQLCMIIASQ
jgi:hypothetical protein